jgi:Kef-type K+ transport system membrane component KefB
MVTAKQWFKAHGLLVWTLLWAAAGIAAAVLIFGFSWETAGDVALIIAALTTTAFAVLYPILAKIRREIGWQMFAFRIVMALILDYLVLVNLGVLSGDERYVPRPFMYGSIAVFNVWLISILVRLQLAGRMQAKEKARADHELA